MAIFAVAHRRSAVQSTRRFALVTVVMFGAASSSCAGVAPAPRSRPVSTPASRPVADLVLTGGTVRTLDPDTPVAAAVAVDDGRIVVVGSEADVEGWIGPSTRQVDLRGRTVVPGLVDSHLHLLGLGKIRVKLNLIGATSLQEVLERVRAGVEAAPPDTWIRGRGWDQNDWNDHQGFPDAAALDRITPHHPVVLERVDGHAIWANSVALRLAGITAKTPSPAGGEIIKKRGEPTGIFIDNASRLIERHIPPYSDEELEQAIRHGQEDCLAAGLTQVHEMGLGPRALDALRRLDARGELRLRVYAMIDGRLEDLTPFMSAGPLVASGNQRLTIRALKFYMDGALGSRGAAMLAPYTDARRQTGLLLMPPTVLEARIRTAKAHGFQVAVHAIGDRANREVLDIYERVYGQDDGTHRPRIEHAQVLHPDDLPRFADLNVIASMQPTHATSDMPWAEQRVGPRRIRTAYAWQSLLKSGAPFAAGSDAPVEDVSPLVGLYAAITRKDLLGFPKTGWYSEERLTPEQALAAFSTAGAYASFREEEAGQIAVGKVADLTVIDKDPLTASEAELASLRTMMTIIDGHIEYARPGAVVAPAPPQELRPKGPGSAPAVR